MATFANDRLETSFGFCKNRQRYRRGRSEAAEQSCHPNETDYAVFLACDLGYGQTGKVWTKLIVAAPVALPHEPGVRPPLTRFRPW